MLEKRINLIYPLYKIHKVRREELVNNIPVIRDQNLQTEMICHHCQVRHLQPVIQINQVINLSML
jgi:hypothetical protein